jgi:asparagine synthase (glutamine-hydrolysing)
MCGIIGKINSDIASPLSLDTFNAALLNLQHRGPDGNSVKIFYSSTCEIQLGFTRLAITDPLPRSDQPFVSPNGKQILVFNGEIFNYKDLRTKLEAKGFTFRTDSDTEVLLSGLIEFGIDFIKNINGMFAFAYINLEENTLYLARDAFGIKPMFFNINTQSISFASEPKALLEIIAQAPKMNLDSVIEYLSEGRYDENEETLVSNLFSINPGTFALFNLNQPINYPLSVQWWKPNLKIESDISFNEASLVLREMVLNNLELHYQSKRPVGVSISGGIDSSVIACGIKYLYPNEKLDTYGYEALGTAFNEQNWILNLVNFLGSNHTKVSFSQAEFNDEIIDVINSQGMPFGTLSIYAQWKVFQAMHNNGVVVSLDGQGADEIFGGYTGYPTHRILQTLTQKKYSKLISFIIKWKSHPQRSISEIMASTYKSLLIARNGSTKNSFFSDFLESPELRQNWFAPFSYEALTKKNLPALLRHGDRNSMAWSIESRQPLLSKEIAEFCFTLPSEYFIGKNGMTKRLLRSSFEKIVPHDLLYRKDKIGFQAPWNMNLSNAINEELLFSPNHIRTMQLLKVDYSYILQHRNRNAEKWRLFNFLKWVELYGVSE